METGSKGGDVKWAGTAPTGNGLGSEGMSWMQGVPPENCGV